METPFTPSAHPYMRALVGKWIHTPYGLPLMGVWFAVCLHFIWAVTLLATESARKTTGIWALSQLFPNRYGLAFLLLVVAGCATTSLFMRLSLAKILLLAPQQIFLGVSAAGAIRAMVLSHFADGVVRPTGFLVADQVPVVLALVVHSATITYLALMKVSGQKWE